MHEASVTPERQPEKSHLSGESVLQTVDKGKGKLPSPPPFVPPEVGPSQPPIHDDDSDSEDDFLRKMMEEQASQAAARKIFQELNPEFVFDEYDETEKKL